MLCERDRSGYFETMARPGRTEPDSVSIWLKLSEEDAARMTQVLARPEFAGWTRAEWCLEMIQTALGYYTRPRPAAGPDRKQAPAAEPEAATEHAPAGEAVAEPAPVPDEPEPVLAAPEPEPEPAANEPESEADEPKRPAQAECPHPADARDYQSGTCAACGAILWD
jgi:hypothetical protein